MFVGFFLFSTNRIGDIEMFPSLHKFSLENDCIDSSSIFPFVSRTFLNSSSKKHPDPAVV